MLLPVLFVYKQKYVIETDVHDVGGYLVNRYCNILVRHHTLDSG